MTIILCSVYENPLFAERVIKFGQKGWEASQKEKKSKKRKSTPSSTSVDEEADDFNTIDFTEDEEKQFDM